MHAMISHWEKSNFDVIVHSVTFVWCFTKAQERMCMLVKYA